MDHTIKQFRKHNRKSLQYRKDFLFYGPTRTLENRRVRRSIIQALKRLALRKKAQDTINE